MIAKGKQPVIEIDFVARFSEQSENEAEVGADAGALPRLTDPSAQLIWIHVFDAPQVGVRK